MSMLIAGLSGAAASILGKICLSEYPLIDKSPALLCANIKWCLDFPIIVVVGIRGLIFFLMLACNGLMLSHFLKALETRGTLPVTVVCSAVNFVVTGILSSLVLGEQINARWWFGALLIIAGIILVLISQGDTKREE